MKPSPLVNIYQSPSGIRGCGGGFPNQKKTFWDELIFALGAWVTPLDCLSIRRANKQCNSLKAAWHISIKRMSKSLPNTEKEYFFPSVINWEKGASRGKIKRTPCGSIFLIIMRSYLCLLEKGRRERVHSLWNLDLSQKKWSMFEKGHGTWIKSFGNQYWSLNTEIIL